MRVTESEEAGWFTPATQPILAQYCRHCIQARHLAGLIEKSFGDPTLGIEDYERLLKMQERESRSMVTLATKLRLTQQSTINPRGNRIKKASIKPWDTDPDEG